MNEILKKYIESNNKKYQRYNSWNHCYKAFGNLNQDSDFLALHLGFYLASWGMYRGSSKLLDKDYKVHVEAVAIIKQFAHLRCNSINEVSSDNIEDILALIRKLSNYYKSKHKVTPTDTLYPQYSIMKLIDMYYWQIGFDLE